MAQQAYFLEPTVYPYPDRRIELVARQPCYQTASFAVLMSVYNGARFLREQIQSIENQSARHIDLWVSDDGSSDATRAILEEAAAGWSKGAFHIIDGPCQGFSENFRSLMRDDRIDADYVAFSDQDDIWDPDKLEAAVRVISCYKPDHPALYGGRTRIVDETGVPIGLSPHFRLEPAFANALVQNIAGGNTMVINRAGWSLLSESARRTSFVSHDWWCYLIISGTGGTVFYDEDPHIGYRQHGQNLVGDNISWRSRLHRLGMLFRGRMAAYGDHNLSGLMRCTDLLTDEALAIVQEFQTIRTERSPMRRLRRLHDSQIYRQTRLENLGLFFAALIRKL